MAKLQEIEVVVKGCWMEQNSPGVGIRVNIFFQCKLMMWIECPGHSSEFAAITKLVTERRMIMEFTGG